MVYIITIQPPTCIIFGDKVSIYQHIIDPSRPINKQNDVAYIPDYGVELPEPPIVTDSGAVLYEGRWGAQTTAGGCMVQRNVQKNPIFVMVRVNYNL